MRPTIAARCLLLITVRLCPAGLGKERRGSL